MQAAKKAVATVKEKVKNASAEVGEKKKATKFAAQEKVEQIKAHGDEDAMAEAAQRRDDKEANAEQRKGQIQAQNAANKDRATNSKSGSIGNRPTPADLGMGEENPSALSMGGAGQTAPGSTIPSYVGPVGSSTVA